MRPRWKKVLADLWGNKTRTLLVVFSIAIGVLAIGVISGAYVIINTDMSVSYAAHNPANLEFRTADFDADLLDAVRNYRDVAAAEARRVIPLRMRLPGSPEWTTFDVVAVEDFAANEVNLLTPLEGQAEARRGEVVLEQDAAIRVGAQVGDTLEVQLADGSIRTLDVVGIVLDPTTSAADFLASPLAYVHFDTLPDLHQPQEFNRLYIMLESGQDDFGHIRERLAEYKKKIENSGVYVGFTRQSRTHYHPLGDIVNAILGILLALGVLILFLSSSLIANTLSALLQQHMRHIGVMKLVGGRNQQILALYLVLMLAFGGLALLIAVPLGGQGAYALAQFIASEIGFTLQGYRIVPLAMLIQVVVGILVPLIAGLGPVLGGTRVSVLEAINGEALRLMSGGDDGGWIDRTLLRITNALARRGAHVPRPILLSIRNTFRNKRRLWLTLFTLTMGGAIFISVFNVRVSLFRYVEQVGNYFLADVTLDFDRSYRINEVATYVEPIPGVQYVEGWTFESAQILTPDGKVVDNLNILAPPANSELVNPLMVEGRWIRADDVRKMTISEGIWDYYPDLHSGDSIQLQINGREETWEVVGIFKFVGIEGILAYTPYEYLAREQNSLNRSFSFRVVTERHDRPYQEAMSKMLDSYLRDNGFELRQARAGLSTLDDASESLNVLIAFLLIMALLTASVGAMGLAGTMGMNVLERTREIGILRAIGGTDARIMGLVIAEGMFIGLISWVLAVVLSVPFSYLLSGIVSQAIFNTPIQVVFTPVGFGLWLLLVILLATVASILPARNAARLTIREVLAYE